ncbi:MAG: helicase-exonuclease AddAB subunit AddA [Bacillota bacterium]|nr:helicase-exonuclease AddAB subunit AddA [Bacillota bacterium]
MTKLEFSDEQKKAIRERGRNMLVAAGAGSGKTTVLVQRLLHYLTAPDKPGSLERVLALTFTNAAAADMRQKIDEALSQLIAEQPDDRHLRRQLALLPRAAISTIHSFCLDLLRGNYYRLGIDAALRIAGEAETAAMTAEVLEELFEREYQREGSLLPQLADAYGGNRDDSELAEIVRRLYEFSRSRPQPAEWLEQICGQMSRAASVEDYPWSEYLLDKLYQDIAYARHALDQARAEAVNHETPPKWLEAISGEIGALNRLLDAPRQWQPALAALRPIEFAALNRGRAGKWDDAACDRIAAYRGGCRDTVKRWQKLFAERSLEQYAGELRAIAPLTAYLGELVQAYDAALTEEKRRRRIIDFTDMEHWALQLLQQPDIRTALRERYDEILIDEYQDINDVQDAILQLLSRGDNFFAVGDVKQSIYRFRLAEPRLFLQKYHGYGERDGDGLRIDLNRNYRSDSTVIAAVNYLFAQLMTKEAAELDYDEAAALKAGREDRGEPSPPELWLIERDRADTADGADAADGGEEPTALEMEARLIAARAGELIRQGYQPRDIAVLLRNASGREDIVAAALNAAGIAAVADKGKSYLEAPEIEMMLAVLKIIDNPLQDIPFAAVLRSPVGGFDADELVELRFAAPHSSYYQAASLYALKDNPCGRKASRFLQQFEEWRRKAADGHIAELIWRIYQDSGFYHLSGAISGGQLRQANLRALYQRAHQYEQGAYAGLFRFIRGIEEGREAGKGAPAAKLFASNQNVVQVMSIHRAKGLEFPVVIVGGLNTPFNFKDEQQDMIWDKDLGLGPRICDRQQRIKYPSLAHTAIALRLHDKAVAEELRICYVAFTRARERLILTACCASGRLDKKCESWAQLLGERRMQLDQDRIAGASSALDWLGMALIRHPDAAVLRDRAGAGGGQRLLAGGPWRLHILPSGELPPPGSQVPANGDAFEQALRQPPQPSPQMLARLDYRYAHADIVDMPAKLSVSALNRLAYPPQYDEDSRYLDEQPAQLGFDFAAADNSASAARRGSVNHLLLERLPLAGACDKEALQDLQARLVAAGRLSAEEARSADIAALTDFLDGELGRRLRGAAEVIREQPFTLYQPLDERRQEHFVVQGVFDAAFAEDGGWVLLDYKTGGWGKSDEQLLAQYATQLGYYRRALEQVGGRPVREAYICMLDLRRNIRVE